MVPSRAPRPSARRSPAPETPPLDRLRPILDALLVPEGVVDLPSGEGKPASIDRLGRLCCRAAGVPEGDVPSVLAALVAREQILSTGIGLGIAVPHVRHASVPREILRVGRSKAGIAFDAIDGKPVHAVFTILMPSGRHRRHVEVLGAIAAALKEQGRREAIFASPDSKTFVERMLAP